MGCFLAVLNASRVAVSRFLPSLLVRLPPLPLPGSGLFLSAMLVGLDVAHWLSAAVGRWSARREARGRPPLSVPPNSFHRRWASLLACLALSLLLATAAAAGVALETADSKTRRLWLACLIAPPGAWLRWYLSRLNLLMAASKGRLSWLPVGTLAANLAASVLEAALSFVVEVRTTQATELPVGTPHWGAEWMVSLPSWPMSGL